MSDPMVTIVLPVAVDLALAIGNAVCDWHEQNCGIEDCRVWMGGEPEGSNARTMTFSHGLPLAVSDAPPEED